MRRFQILEHIASPKALVVSGLWLEGMAERGRKKAPTGRTGRGRCDGIMSYIGRGWTDYAKCNSVADTPISAMASVVLVGVTAAAIAMPLEIDASGVL